jgi:hypothetical protein
MVLAMEGVFFIDFWLYSDNLSSWYTSDDCDCDADCDECTLKIFLKFVHWCSCVHVGYLPTMVY